MLPRDKSGMRKLRAENMDPCLTELTWDELGVPRDFKFTMNLFIST